MDQEQLTYAEIVARLDDLGRAARLRMAEAPNQPGLIWSELFWMNDEEVAEVHRLKAMLPTAGEERAEAIARLAAKLAKRKRR
ncbi:hypothetical protein QEM13_002012 [Pseudomonas putida]|nr:hypothetical protein [Pseudomonas putida]